MDQVSRTHVVGEVARLVEPSFAEGIVYKFGVCKVWPAKVLAGEANASDVELACNSDGLHAHALIEHIARVVGKGWADPDETVIGLDLANASLDSCLCWPVAVPQRHARGPSAAEGKRKSLPADCDDTERSQVFGVDNSQRRRREKRVRCLTLHQCSVPVTSPQHQKGSRQSSQHVVPERDIERWGRPLEDAIRWSNAPHIDEDGCKVDGTPVLQHRTLWPACASRGEDDHHGVILSRVLGEWLWRERHDLLTKFIQHNQTPTIILRNRPFHLLGERDNRCLRILEHPGDALRRMSHVNRHKSS
eukprot:7389929-Prymnesium_polylepis.1